MDCLGLPTPLPMFLLHFLLVLLLGKEALLDSPAVLLNASFAVDRSKVDEVERVEQQYVLDLSVQRRVGRKTRRMIHLQVCTPPMQSTVRPATRPTQTCIPQGSLNSLN